MKIETEAAARYWWFQGTAVRALAERLAEAGPDTARLEVRLTGDKMTLRVVAADAGRDAGKNGAVAADDINDSRLCPPICP